MATSTPTKGPSTNYTETWGALNASTTTQADRKERTEKTKDVVSTFYDWATDIYIEGWSPSFHFSPLQPGESYLNGLRRSEDFMALMLELKPGMRVLELGCGIGAPAREIARFSGAHVTGVNLHKYQLYLAQKWTEKEGMQDRVDFLEADFMNLPFADESFDAVYAIEATCHAPSMEGVYREAKRVLKPGGRFGTYEFCMSALYDDANPVHREMRTKIEFGNGVTSLQTPRLCLEAFESVGYEDVWSRDVLLGDDGINTVPWWYPMDGQMCTAKSMQEKIRVFFMKEIVAKTVFKVFNLLRMIGLVPKAQFIAMKTMHLAVFTMRDAGRLGIFTPDFMIVGRKCGKTKE